MGNDISIIGKKIWKDLSYRKTKKRTKQRRELNKKVFHEFYGKKRRYSVEDVLESYEVTNIPKEIVKIGLEKIVGKDKYYQPKKVRQLKVSKKESKLEKSLAISVIKGVGSSVINIGEGIILPSLAFPTAARKFVENIRQFEDGEKPTSLFYNISFIISHLMTGAVPVTLYNFYNDTFKTNPQIGTMVLMGQIATNVISLGYEIIRGIVKRDKPISRDEARLERGV